MEKSDSVIISVVSHLLVTKTKVSEKGIQSQRDKLDSNVLLMASLVPAVSPSVHHDWSSPQADMMVEKSTRIFE